MFFHFLFACFVCACNAQNVVRMQEAKMDMPLRNGGYPERTGSGIGFAFATYYNDHMVLQQSPKQAVVWGTYSDVGARLILKVNELEKNYTADVRQGSDGPVWSVTLDPIPAGGPYTITVYAESDSITIKDVLFGDVWLCSGQSNMKFSTDQIFDAAAELNASSQYTGIRLFTVAMNYSATPLSDLLGVDEKWSLPSPDTVGHLPFTYMSAVCWLFGRRLYQELGYPIGLIDTSWGGTPVEAWSSHDALAKCGLADQGPSEDPLVQREYTPLKGQRDNSQLWNAMVHPLLNMTIYGAIWYQGENDSKDPTKMHHYNCTFPSMIDDWRVKFAAASGQTSGDFPFGFVQLSANAPDMSKTVGFPNIRWHQTADYGYVPNAAMKNVFMAVAMDLPDFTSPYGSVHTRDKQDVADRLMMSGMHVAYGKTSSPLEGPRPVSVRQQGDSVILTYSADTGNIVLANRQGFEFCCSFTGKDECSHGNAWWLPSPIVSSTTDSLTLDGSVCGEGQFTAGLRYAWRVSPCVFKRCAVYSGTTGLPAPPFVTVKPASAGADFTYTIDWSKPQVIPM